MASGPKYTRTTADLSQFEGTDYYDEAKAIVDKYANKVYSPNWLATIGRDVLGDYSGEDNFYQELDMQRDSELQQLLDSLRVETHQEDYQDPNSEASRMRAAGQNPDLLGTNGTEGGAAAVPPDETPPGVFDSASSEGSLTALFSTVGSVASIIAGGIDIAGLIRDFSHQGRMNALQEISTLAGSQPGLSTLLAGLNPDSVSSPSPDMSPGVGVGEDINDPHYKPLEDSIEPSVSVSTSKVPDAIDSLPVSKRAKKMLRKLQKSVGTGVASDELRSQRLEAQKQGEVNKFWLELFKNEGDSIKELGELDVKLARLKKEFDIKMNSPELASATYNAQMASQGAALQQAQYESEFFDKLDPELAATGSNEEAIKRRYESQRDAIIAKQNAVIEKYFDGALSSVQTISDPVERFNASTSIYKARNDYWSELSARRIQAETVAGKTIGETDYLDAFKSTIGSLNPIKKR